MCEMAAELGCGSGQQTEEHALEFEKRDLFQESFVLCVNFLHATVLRELDELEQLFCECACVGGWVRALACACMCRMSCYRAP